MTITTGRFDPIPSRSQRLQQDRLTGTFGGDGFSQFAPGVRHGVSDPGESGGFWGWAFGNQSPLEAAGDLLLAPIRGVEGFVQSVYGLADTMFQDILPDYDERLLGTSQGGIAGFLEGTTEFLTGFVPVVGWVGRGSRLIQLGRYGSRAGELSGLARLGHQVAGTAGRAGRRVGFLDDAGRVRALQGLSDEAIAAAQGRGLFGLSPLSRSTHLSLRRAAVAGAVTDFVAFQGHDARLSNLLTSFGGVLDNDVTRFLAADEDDPELLGRLKNSIEGLLVGSLFDAGVELTRAARQSVSSMATNTVEGIRAVKRGREAAARGAGIDEVDRVVADASEVMFRDVPDAVPTDDRAAQLVDQSVLGLVEETPIVGAPPQAVNTHARTNLREFLHLGTVVGDLGPAWATDVGQASLRVTGGQVDDASRLIRVAGLLSGNRSEELNLDVALRLYSAWKGGATRSDIAEALPGSPLQVGTPEQQRRAASILFDDAPWTGDPLSGRSSDELFDQMISEVDPSRRRGPASDRALARSFGFSDDALDAGGRRDLVREETERLAAELGWDIDEAEAALWIHGRDLWEEVRQDVEQTARERGMKTLDMSNPAFRRLYGQKVREAVRARFQPKDGGTFLDPGQAVDFAEHLRGPLPPYRLRNQPDQSVFPLPGLASGSPAAQVAFERDIESVLQGGPDGVDRLAAALGLGASPTARELQAYARLRALQLGQTDVREFEWAGGELVPTGQMLEEDTNAKDLAQKLTANGFGRALGEVEAGIGADLARVREKWAQREGRGRGLGLAFFDPDRRFGPTGFGTAYDRGAQRLVASDGTPVPVNFDGSVSLYLRTSREEADRLRFGGRPDGEDVLLSSDPVGHPDGRGNTVVEFQVDPGDVELTRQHPDGVDVRVSSAGLGPRQSTLRTRWLPDVRVERPRQRGDEISFGVFRGRRKVLDLVGVEVQTPGVANGRTHFELLSHPPSGQGLVDSGVWQDALQRVADRYPGGLRIPTFTAGPVGEALRRMPNVVETPESFRVPANVDGLAQTQGLLPISHPGEFSKMLRQAHGSPGSGSVTPYTSTQIRAKALNGVRPRLMASADGRMGYMLTPTDGGGWLLEGLFNRGGPPGAGRELMLDAVERGATQVQVFDGVAASVAHSLGFQVTRRERFDWRRAPEEWRVGRGEPEILTMDLRAELRADPSQARQRAGSWGPFEVRAPEPPTRAGDPEDVVGDPQALAERVLDERYVSNEERALAGNKIPRGAQAISQRLRMAVNLGQSAGRRLQRNPDDRAAQRAFARSPQFDEVRTIEQFIDRVGERLFADIGISIRSVRPEGYFDWGTSIVTIGTKSLERGHFDRVALHELWHSLERVLRPDEAAGIARQFERERGRYLQAHPEFAQVLESGRGFTEENYRYKNADEWFAETMTDRTLDRLDELDVASRSLFAHAKLVVREILAALRAKFSFLGFDPTQKIFDDFLSGRKGMEPTHRVSGIADDSDRFFMAARGPDARRVDPEDARYRLLTRLVVDEDTARTILDDVRDRRESGFEAGFNPRAVDEDGHFVHSSEELLEQRLRREDLNLSAYEGTDGALQLLRTFESLFRSVIDEGGEMPTLPRPISLDEQQAQALQALSDITGARDPMSLQATLIRDLAQDNTLLRTLNARVLAYKSLLLTYSEQLASQVDTAIRGGDQDLVAFARQSDFLADLASGVKGLLAEQGRGLGANRLPIRNLLDDAEALAAAVRDRGGRDAMHRQAERFRTAWGEGGEEGAAALTRLARVSRSRRAVNILTEYWINSILSGMKTLSVNTLGNLMTTIYRPLESMLGGAIARDARVIHDSVREVVYLLGAVPDSMRFAARATRENRNILDPAQTVLDVPDHQRFAITPENLGVGQDQHPWLHPAISWLGSAVRIPSAILTGTDEFFKQMNFRAKLRADLVRQGLDEGLTSEEAARAAVEGMDAYFFQGQAYSSATTYRAGLEDGRAQGISDENLLAEHASNYQRDNFDPDRAGLARGALDRAEEVTFTQPLPQGSLSSTVQQAVNRHPLLRFVLPFVRTPINILRFTGQRYDAIGAAQALVAARFPAAAVRLQSSQRRIVQDVLSGDPRRRADALGRFAMGMGVAWYVLGKAGEGAITGRGPSDQEQRRLLTAAGWQPYSFRVGDGYVSYQRMDPFATMIGLAADMLDYGRWADADQQDSLETLVMAVGVALANNFTNKSYLTGLQNFVEALESPDRHVPKLVQRYAASFLPSFGAQAVGLAGDDVMRDVQSLSDAMANRLPFFSSGVDPVRNVLGEPVRRIRSLGSDEIGSIMDAWLPIAYREVEDDVILQEFASLNHGFSPPRSQVRGVDLRDFEMSGGQSAFDRWQELHGIVKIGGADLRTTLRRLIRSTAYKALSPVSTTEVESPRIGHVRRVIERYRRAAFQRLLSESRQLRDAVGQVDRTRRQLRRGIETRLLPMR